MKNSKCVASSANSNPCEIAGDMVSPQFSSAHMEATLTNEQQQALEALLVVGNRDDALAMALRLEQYPLAMLIGTVCGREHFQQAVKAYADKTFAPSSSLHFISMIYSNQATHVLKQGGTRLMPSKASNDPNSTSRYGSVSQGQTFRPQPVSWQNASPIVRDWKKHLGSILSNKSGDWVDLAKSLGERVYNETHVRMIMCSILTFSAAFNCLLI